MPVNIQISGENAGEAVKELSVLASHLVFQGASVAPGSAEVAASAEPSTSKAPDKPARTRAKKEDEPKQPEVKQPEQPEVDDPNEASSNHMSDEAADPQMDDETPAPSVVELRAKAQEVGKTPEGKKSIKALLDEFGSKSISDVPEAQRAAFLAKLEGLA